MQAVVSSSPIRHQLPAYPKNRLSEHILRSGFSSRMHATEEDLQLTDQFLEPVRQEIVQLFAQYRHAVDAEIRSQFGAEELAQAACSGIRVAREYPCGWCDEIQTGIFERLMKKIDRCRDDSISLRPLRAARRAGCTMKLAYGIGHGAQGDYFQNLIQLGSWVVDCAPDSTTTLEPMAVAIHPINSGAFRNLDSFDGYYRAAAQYWGCRAYSLAEHLPALAPLCPAILLFADQTYAIHVDEALLNRNVALGFSLSLDFFRGWRDPSALPDWCRQGLKKRFSNEDSVWRFCERGRSTVRSAVELCHEYRSYWRALMKRPSHAPEVEEHLAFLKGFARRVSEYNPL